MATAVWQDDNSTWDSAANWSGGSGAGGIPANNDTAIISSGTQDIDTNLVTTLTGVTLRIGPGYTGKIGTSTSWLDIDGPLFDFDSGGQECYVTGTWTSVVVHGGISGENMLNWKANASTDIGTLRVIGSSGTTTVGAGAVLDDLVVVNAPSATVTVAANVTSLDNVTVEDGEVTVSSSIATLAECRGGHLTVAGSATVAQLDTEGSGVVSYNSSGTITTFNGWGGQFDGRDNQNAAVSITTPTVHEGCTMDLRNALRTWVGLAIVNNGGIVLPPPGSTMTIS